MKRKKYRELKESIRMMNSQRIDTERINLIEEGKRISVNEVINSICTREGGGRVNMTPLPSPSPSQFFCDNFFFKNAIKLKFSDFHFMPFRHILTKLHVMYPWDSKLLTILLEGDKKKNYTKFTIFLIFTCMCIY